MTKKIRYAVVGAGWISQEAFMPSIEQTGNSEMTAIVSGNAQGAEKLAKFYGIPHVFSYEQYDEMLKQGVVDAVYIALPNSMHADYTIRALNAASMRWWRSRSPPRSRSASAWWRRRRPGMCC